MWPHYCPGGHGGGLAAAAAIQQAPLLAQSCCHQRGGCRSHTRVCATAAAAAEGSVCGTGGGRSWRGVDGSEVGKGYQERSVRSGRAERLSMEQQQSWTVTRIPAGMKSPWHKVGSRVKRSRTRDRQRTRRPGSGSPTWHGCMNTPSATGLHHHQLAVQRRECSAHSVKHPTPRATSYPPPPRRTLQCSLVCGAPTYNQPKGLLVAEPPELPGMGLAARL